MLKNFRFSPVATITSLVLAGIMLRCSYWQWERYLEKRELVESYRRHSSSSALALPSDESEIQRAINHKVGASGRYDYQHQMLIANRRHASGPGFWLITPFLPTNSEKHILVSRGFIPYEHGNTQDIERYTFAVDEGLEGVLKEAVAPKSFLGCSGPRSAKVEDESGFVLTWFYPEIDKMAQQLPYPVENRYYLQRLGDAPVGTPFPAEAVSIEVPPSTHFGYFIEWILLAIATIVAGIAYQAWPRRKKIPQDPGKTLMH